MSTTHPIQILKSSEITLTPADERAMRSFKRKVGAVIRFQGHTLSVYTAVESTPWRQKAGCTRCGYHLIIDLRQADASGPALINRCDNAAKAVR